ncbi:hypothetical protein [uncultured Algibacter sp.]|uniref:hypothetical protein n=1 Tax=uncultured Algibacter sp. TaxID=298659 RepID=UPI00321643D5
MKKSLKKETSISKFSTKEITSESNLLNAQGGGAYLTYPPNRAYNSGRRNGGRR